MGKWQRRQCDGTQCRDPTHFHPARAPAGGDPFFKPVAAGPADAPAVQTQGAPTAADDEKKDPVAEGFKTVGSHLFEHEPLKKAIEPIGKQLKLTLWDNMKPAEKAAMLSFAGVNLGMAGAAFAANPQLCNSFSDVNIGKPLGWIPYSPIEGFKYQLPGAGKTATGLSADFTLNPYLELVHKRWPHFPLTGATLGLESSDDTAAKRFNLTGGKLGLDFFGGGLKAEGKTFNELSPYPQLNLGPDGMSSSWTMQELPGMPTMKTGLGYQFMLNADIMKLLAWFGKNRK